MIWKDNLQITKKEKPIQQKYIINEEIAPIQLDYLISNKKPSKKSKINNIECRKNHNSSEDDSNNLNDYNLKENQNSYNLDNNSTLSSKNIHKDSNKKQNKHSKLETSDKNNKKQYNNFIFDKYKIENEINKENDLNHLNIMCKEEIINPNLTKSTRKFNRKLNKLQSLSDRNFGNSTFNFIGDYIINTKNSNKKFDNYKTDKKIDLGFSKDLNFQNVKSKKSKKLLEGVKIEILQANEQVKLNKSVPNHKQDNNIYKKTINDYNDVVELKKGLEKINTDSLFKNITNLNQFSKDNNIINNYTHKISNNFIFEKDTPNKLSAKNSLFKNDSSEKNKLFNKDYILENNKKKSNINNGNLPCLNLDNYFSYNKFNIENNTKNIIENKLLNKNEFKNQNKNSDINKIANKKTENIEDNNNKIQYIIEDYNKNRNLITMKEEFFYTDKKALRKEESEIINSSQKANDQYVDSEFQKINIKVSEEINNYGTLENNTLPKIHIKPENLSFMSVKNLKSISEKILINKNKILNFNENADKINHGKDLNLNYFEERSKFTHKLNYRFSQSYEVFRSKYNDIQSNKKSYYFGNNSPSILYKSTHNCINKRTHDFIKNNLKISNKNTSQTKLNKTISYKKNIILNNDCLIKDIEINTIKMNKGSQNINLSIKGIEKEIKDEKNFTCRICLESNIIQATTDEEYKYISPCLCHGTMKYVHESCLKKWIPNQVKKLSKAECEICKCSYKLKFETKRIYSSEKMCVFLEKFFTFIGIICLLLFIIDFVIYSIVVNIVKFNTQEKDTFTLILSLSGVGILLIVIALILRNYKKHVYEIYPIGWTVLEHDSKDDYEKNVTYELFRKLEIELENNNRSNFENINLMIENNNNIEENNQINFNQININYHDNQSNNLPSNMNLADVINENNDFNNNLYENFNTNPNNNGNIDIINVPNEENIRIKSNDRLNDLSNQDNKNIINDLQNPNLYNKGSIRIDNHNKSENINNDDIQFSETHKSIRGYNKNTIQIPQDKNL